MALASAEDEVVPSRTTIRIVEDTPGPSTSFTVSLIRNFLLCYPMIVDRRL